MACHHCHSATQCSSSFRTWQLQGVLRRTICHRLPWLSSSVGGGPSPLSPAAPRGGVTASTSWRRHPNSTFQSAPKERRRRRAEKRLSNRAHFWHASPFQSLQPSVVVAFAHGKQPPAKCFHENLALSGQRRNGLSKNTLFGQPFLQARRLSSQTPLAPP